MGHVISVAANIAQVVIAAFAIWAVFVSRTQTGIARRSVQDQQRAARTQQEMTRDNFRVQLLLLYEQRFGSLEMKRERAALAQLLSQKESYNATGALTDGTYDLIRDDVLAFFESIGTMLRLEKLDPEQVYIFFEHYAWHYWRALEPYITRDRAENGADMWVEFESVIRAMDDFHRIRHGRGIEPASSEEVERFLREESYLFRIEELRRILRP